MIVFEKLMGVETLQFGPFVTINARYVLYKYGISGDLTSVRSSS